MKRRKTKMLMLMTLCFILSLSVCANAAEYIRLGSQASVRDEPKQALNTVKVFVSSGELKAGDMVFLRLPKDFVFNGGSWSYGEDDANVYYGDYDDGCYIYIPWDEDNGLNMAKDDEGNPVPTDIFSVDQHRDNEINIKVKDVLDYPSITQDGYFFIYLKDVDIPGGFKGAIDFSFYAPPGSGFGPGEVTGGRVGRLDPQKEEPVNPVSGNTGTDQPENDTTPAEEAPEDQGDDLTVVFTVGSMTFTVNGQTQTMDTAPYIKNGRTFLPIKFAVLSLGVNENSIKWNNGTASFLLSGKNVSLAIGSKVMLVNGEEEPIDAAPEISHGRLMLPVKWLGDVLDYSVLWNPQDRTVTISNSK